jgi:hypothetical protein
VISFNENFELSVAGGASYFSVDPVAVLKGPVQDDFRYRRDVSQLNQFASGDVVGKNLSSTSGGVPDSELQ